jgi:hypothetical protein
MTVFTHSWRQADLGAIAGAVKATIMTKSLDQSGSTTRVHGKDWRSNLP